ncbi:right-handed parallel beta-helix repeat-containing protein [Winogradskyella forsetii]|uniref:right-handed parallel beta-helix repeat-containing protein n=1 Tax=Winogradskyella forsetii TaxID=2686077 RepID=UPI0015B9313C|nr:right-handed parallel beta-helix repeat-containing protein [Winogradskyella forsetii]
MKKIVVLILCLFTVVLTYAQQEFHVFPENHTDTPGTQTGNGSLQNPWDLQTALSQKSKVVNGGDTIWLHGGIYNGRFSSTLNSTIKDKYITVSAYKDDKVVLNGNVESSQDQTLNVRSSRVIFQNFEVTWLGEFSRQIDVNGGFTKFVAGVYHLSGKNCKFINLMIYNNPGLGFGSWKHTGGTLIANCIVFNNGALSSDGKGRGEGFYVQNNSDTETRILKDNIIFNNYYKGIEVWSASKHATSEWVKNITLDNNVIFNSGLPSNYRTVDNIIVATDDREGINIAENITVKNNILYHNTNFRKNEVNGDAASLTIGFHKNAPVENVIVDNNIIIGRNNAFRVLYANSLTVTDNIIYTGYVHLFSLNTERWNFNNNQYYTKKSRAFRRSNTENYNIKNWISKFNLDANSQWKPIKEFDLDPILDITENTYKPNTFRVVLFNKNNEDVIVDFSKYGLKEGTNFIIRDVENYNEVLRTGRIDGMSQISFPMTLNGGDPNKTLNNFGVFLVEFQEDETTEAQKDGFFKRFFRFLGF